MTEHQKSVNKVSDSSEETETYDSIHPGTGQDSDESMDAGDQKKEQDQELENAPGSKLSWLINDFSEVSVSVYEAAMIASVRSRQIGRRQKQEVDNWFSAHDITEGAEEEEESEPGVDNFNHPKPTIQALRELTNNKLKFRYLDDNEK